MSADDQFEARRVRFARPRLCVLAICPAVVLAVAAMSACSDDDENESAQTGTAPAKPAVPAGPVLGEEPDPEKINCAHLANRENNTAVYDAAYTLAQDVKLPDASEKEVASRLLVALNGLCEKRPEADYRPAEDAVAAVKRGEYEREGALK